MAADAAVLASTGGVAAGYVRQLFIGAQPRVSADRPILIGAIPREADCFQLREYAGQLKCAWGSGETSSNLRLLIGPGGVGKTQLAAHVARQALQSKNVDVVVWASAGSREAVQSAYAQAIAELTGADSSDIEHAAERFLAWTHTTDQKWLLVLDDLTTPATLRGLWPAEHTHGFVLVTSRRRDSALSGERISVGNFHPSEAAHYLEAKLAAHGRVEDANQIAALVEDLGCLPLALSQAAAYLIDSNLSCASYRAVLADRKRALMELFPDVASLPDDQDVAVNATWSLSIEQADLLPPVGMARPMLQLASVLDHAGIPEAVFMSDAALTYMEEWIALEGCHTSKAGEYDVDELTVMKTLRNLHRLCLVDYETDVVLIHSLVQRAVIDNSTPEQFARSIIAAADGVLELWPETIDSSQEIRMLRSNAEILLRYTDPALLGDAFCHDLLFRFGDALMELGLASSAAAYFTDLRMKIERVSMSDREDLYFVRLSLADALMELGNIGGALSEYRSLLQDEIQRQGPDAEDVLHVRSILAEAIGRTGDALGSVRAFEDLLRDRMRTQGPDHAMTFDTRRRLVTARSHSGDVAGAIAECEDLLADEMRVCGGSNAQTRHTRLHLAEEIGRSGDIDGAINILKEIVDEELRIYGVGDERTFNSLHRLGEWYLDVSSTKAVRIFRNLVHDAGEVFGASHPYVLDFQAHLADALGSSGELDAAITTSESILEIRLRDLGPEHPDTLDARSLLAHWKGRSGDIGTAVQEYLNIFKDCESVLGADHPHTIAVLGRVAKWLRSSGDVDAALLAFKRLVHDKVRVHGPDDPRSLRARDDLAYHVLQMGDFESALAAFRLLHAEQVRLLGEDHPDTIHTSEHIEDLER